MNWADYYVVLPIGFAGAGVLLLEKIGILSKDSKLVSMTYVAIGGSFMLKGYVSSMFFLGAVGALVSLNGISMLWPSQDSGSAGSPEQF